MKKAILVIHLFLITNTILSSCSEDGESSYYDYDSEYGEFTDSRDGHIYKTIKIGEQIWMAENLAATKYNDSTAIPNVTDGSNWVTLSTPAYCWYDNEKETYSNTGVLYNWFVVETGKLCPTGWHVPTHSEWLTLEDYLANNDYNYDGSIGDAREKISKAMAATNEWKTSMVEGAPGNIDYTEYQNKSGFTALPGGSRSGSTGSFANSDEAGYWWSSTGYSNLAWCRYIVYDKPNVAWATPIQKTGLSVRCIKDK
ncbi:fibrobacter succinogenes major paralogous domain-containing protein [Roseimarinus sediminis]|uniref:fibrobacter succinogenes major paralogous domain-containing protein n=1 Tax=Roseimarinus sediminis TaxID=1610899 RepID=UPI003D19C520